MEGYFYIPYRYLVEKRLINYLDGLWAITDIIPRTNHKPTVRRLVVPGHSYDEKQRRDYERYKMNSLQKMMMTMRLPTHQRLSYNQMSMPLIKRHTTQFWY